MEFTGTQWINTKFAPNRNDVRVIIDADISKGDYIVWGVYGSNPMLNNNFYQRSSIYFRYRDYNKSFRMAGGRHTVETGPKMKVDGSTKATPSFSSSNTFVGNTKKITIGGRPNAAEPTGVSTTCKGKIYEFSIYYSDELQMHLIPVRVGQTGYFYDTVSKTKFGNSGTGSFILGADKNN